MTKGELTAMVKARLSGGYSDRVSKFDDRIIGKFINTSLEQFMSNHIKGSGIADDLVKVYFPFVQWDKLRQVCFIKLPKTILHLDDNSELQWVSAKEDEETQWIIEPMGAQMVFANLEAGAVSNVTGYVESDKVIFPQLQKRWKGKCIKIKVIVGVDGYSNDEVIKIGSEYINSIIQTAVNMMQPMVAIPEKISNDGNSNTK